MAAVGHANAAAPGTSGPPPRRRPLPRYGPEVFAGRAEDEESFGGVADGTGTAAARAAVGDIAALLAGIAGPEPRQPDGFGPGPSRKRAFLTSPVLDVARAPDGRDPSAVDADDDASEDPDEPPVSAAATAGMAAIAAPMPKPTASAPTRPMAAG